MDAVSVNAIAYVWMVRLVGASTREKERKSARVRMTAAMMCEQKTTTSLFEISTDAYARTSILMRPQILSNGASDRSK
jgi:hypothetical protein